MINTWIVRIAPHPKHSLTQLGILLEMASAVRQDAIKHERLPSTVPSAGFVPVLVTTCMRKANLDKREQITCSGRFCFAPAVPSPWCLVAP